MWGRVESKWFLLQEGVDPGVRDPGVDPSTALG